MQKFWKINNSKSNTLIFIKDEVIYKGNPKIEDLNKLNSESKNLHFLDNLFSIPYSYIKCIENQTGKEEIKIFYGNDSEEEIKVKNELIKNEIFDFLKEDIPYFKYSSKTPSILKYAKRQLFSLLFTTIIFLWSFYLAIQIENGAEYIIPGNKRPGIITIILMIASLGTFQIIIGFIVLITIIFFALKNRLKTRSETQFLKR